MEQFRLEDSAQGKILHIEGSLTIEQAGSLKDMLLKVLETEDDVSIDLKKAAPVDLACVQVLCAAHKTFLKAHKRMSIQEGLPATFRKNLSDIALDQSTQAMVFHIE